MCLVSILLKECIKGSDATKTRRGRPDAGCQIDRKVFHPEDRAQFTQLPFNLFPNVQPTTTSQNPSSLASGKVDDHLLPRWSCSLFHIYQFLMEFPEIPFISGEALIFPLPESDVSFSILSLLSKLSRTW